MSQMVRQPPANTLYIDDAAPIGPAAHDVFLAYIERAARALPTQRPDAQLDALDNQHNFYQRRIMEIEIEPICAPDLAA